MNSCPNLRCCPSPYLFESEKVADFAFGQELIPVVNELLNEHDLVALQWAEIGWVQFAADRPMSTPDLARRLTLRISDSTAEREFAASLRASPLALALDEIAAALEFELEDESDRIDGGFVTVSGHYFVTSDHWPALTLTNHGFKAGLFVAGRAWLDELEPTERTDLLRAFEQMQTPRESVRRQTQEALSFMADTGASVTSLSVSEYQAWVAAGLAAHGPILTRIGGRAQYLYDAVNAAKEAYLASPDATGALGPAADQP